jgi:DNA-binding NarL/FixJ family response regulator
MSRQFLVINHSSTLRKIVRTQIRANLNDAVVLEAEQADEALRMIRDRQCHMALFLWDQALPQDPELLQKLAELPEDQRVPTLVMTTDVRGETLDRFRQVSMNTCPSPACRKRWQRHSTASAIRSLYAATSATPSPTPIFFSSSEATPLKAPSSMPASAGF